MCKISTKIIEVYGSWNSSKFPVLRIFQTKYLVSRNQQNFVWIAVWHFALLKLVLPNYKESQSIKLNFILTTRAISKKWGTVFYFGVLWMKPHYFHTKLPCQKQKDKLNGEYKVDLTQSTLKVFYNKILYLFKNLIST